MEISHYTLFIKCDTLDEKFNRRMMHFFKLIVAFTFILKCILHNIERLTKIITCQQNLEIL